MRSARGQLQRNSGDLLRQGCEVLRFRSQNSSAHGHCSGAIHEVIDLLGQYDNGRNLLGGRTGGGGSSRTLKEGGDRGGSRGTNDEAVPFPRHGIDARVERVPVVKHAADVFGGPGGG
jgi:hypothetical protein